ncbi:beta-1,3-galactosyltransferase 1-like isoform X2 [Mya arenaria]|uniref:beta-1,3-galactosyltransferase 1-like isoform X2 n=1 Tax=Mya arenaria TaxID=6604 RepID=UPI0022E65C0F|nr:beta-1,3-galactosyltransferase 1-like isoform X2 [Mya arenaria]
MHSNATVVFARRAIVVLSICGLSLTLFYNNTLNQAKIKVLARAGYPTDKPGYVNLSWYTPDARVQYINSIFQEAIGKTKVNSILTNGFKTVYQVEALSKLADADDFGNIKYSHGNKRKSSCENCFPHNFNYIINNADICQEVNKNIPKMLILIFTEHENYFKRKAIRKTWLTFSEDNTSNVRYVFLLGLTSDTHLADAVLKENELYRDIIKEDFTDSYRNLTLKTIMGLKWVTHNCPNVQYVMKTDDDVYVNIPAIMRMLKKNNNLKKNNSIIGSCFVNVSPIRDKQSKWYASENAYPGELYPRFCSGTGYIMSSKVASHLFEISPNIPFFHLEDVFIGLCMDALGYKSIPTRGFYSYWQIN